MQQLTIAHLYPEQMNIYGDRGNILTLVQRCRWRGIDVRVDGIKPGQAVDWTSYDLAFFGGGQDSGQALVADDFVQRHGPALKSAVDDGLVLLAICGGYQLLGHYFLTHTGEKLPGIGALDLHTVGGEKRLIGNIVVDTTDARFAGKGQQLGARHLTLHASRLLVGFENHSGRTYLGTGVKPLGRVQRGFGNNGEDGTEGAVYQNTHGCYMHGSLLPKNPHFADHLLGLALQRRYGTADVLVPLDDMLEVRAHDTMVARLQ
jgi:CobQ-like glutamine amidotransferase family enzyme